MLRRILKRFLKPSQKEQEKLCVAFLEESGYEVDTKCCSACQTLRETLEVSREFINS